MQIVDGKDYLSEVKKLIIEYSKRLVISEYRRGITESGS